MVGAPLTTPEFLQGLDYHALANVGGPEKLMEALGTHPRRGLALPRDYQSEGKDADGVAFQTLINERRRVFGANELHPRPKMGLRLLWEAILGERRTIYLVTLLPVLLVLKSVDNLVSADSEQWARRALSDFLVVSAVGLVQVPLEYYIVTQEQHRLVKLADMAQKRPARCLRNGEEVDLLAEEIVVGDIFTLDSGNVVPCNGLVLAAHDLICLPGIDKSRVQESRKITYRRYSALDRTQLEEGIYSCFVSGGDRVTEGWARCVATSVGVRSDSYLGLMARSKWKYRPEVKSSYHSRDLPKRCIAAILGLLLFPFIKSFVESRYMNKTGYLTVEGYTRYASMVLVSFIVILTPAPLTGLRLVRASAYRHLRRSAILEQLCGACESMDDIKHLVFDKTGTMTEDLTVLMEGTIGATTTFKRPTSSSTAVVGEDRNEGEILNALVDSSINGERHHPNSISWTTLRDDAPLRDMLHPAIVATSSTPSENTEKPQRNGVDWCLLDFAREMGWPDAEKVWEETMECVEVMPFSSARKASGAVVKLKDHGILRLFVKGAKDEVLPKCTNHLVHSPSVGVDGVDLVTSDAASLGVAGLDEKLRREVGELGDYYASNGLRSIVLGYKDLDRWSPSDDGGDGVPTQVLYDEIAHDLTLIGLFCLEDSLSPGVRDAFSQLIHTGMVIHMCTGDSPASAVSVARTCGIPKAQVYSATTPRGKMELLRKIFPSAMVGNGTNDIPAFKASAVSFCMGLTGTEAAKDTADIMLEDDDVARVLEVARQGRRVVDAWSRYRNFWTCAGVSTLAVTFAVSVVTPLIFSPGAWTVEADTLFSINQLLWIYVVVVPAGLLVFMMSSPDVFDIERERGPYVMQTTVEYEYFLSAQMGMQPFFTALLYFSGPRIVSALFGGGHLYEEDALVVERASTARTMAFNTFMFIQILTCFLVWKMDKRVSLDRAWMNKHRISVGICFAVIVGQYFVVMKMGNIFQTVPLDMRGWVVCLAFAMGCVGLARLAIVPLRVLVSATGR